MSEMQYQAFDRITGEEAERLFTGLEQALAGKMERRIPVERTSLLRGRLASCYGTGVIPGSSIDSGRRIMEGYGIQPGRSLLAINGRKPVHLSSGDFAACQEALQEAGIPFLAGDAHGNFPSPESGEGLVAERSVCFIDTAAWLTTQKDIFWERVEARL